jgi:membrane-associated phospholipid phosphatase
MLTRINDGNRNLTNGIIITAITGLYLLVTSFVIGRNDFFLLLNNDLGKTADIFFAFWTNLGDGVIWVIVAGLVLKYRRKQFPLLIATIVISTLITQLTKIYVIPAEPRPTVAIKDINLIHTVADVELHTAYSFPSGHTAAAFCIFFIGCLLINKRWVVPVGFAYALLVGYSRIYLAQHFPLDVGAGMFVAIVTILLSILIQQKWERRKYL